MDWFFRYLTIKCLVLDVRYHFFEYFGRTDDWFWLDHHGSMYISFSDAHTWATSKISYILKPKVTTNQEYMSSEKTSLFHKMRSLAKNLFICKFTRHEVSYRRSLVGNLTWSHLKVHGPICEDGWWYHSLTSHQHQKGHTVPKQVIMIATSIQVATV